MPTVTKTATLNVKAKPEKIWKVLSDDFLNVSKWAGGVSESGPNPKAKNSKTSAPHAGRICQVDGMGETDERVVEYSSEDMVIAYTIAAKKIPFFVKEMKSRWQVKPSGKDSSEVTLEVSAETKGLLGYIGQFPIAKMLKGAAPGLAGDLKKYIEKQ